MRQFEYAMRDFINIEKHCIAQSIVLIHDCYPLNRQTAECMRTTTFWGGDVWRLILIFKKYRPELRVHTIATPPTGLGVVLGLDPASSVLERNLDDIVTEFIALDYSVLESDKPGMLNLFPNDLEKIRALLHQAGV
jgi:hypothetical protein